MPDFDDSPPIELDDLQRDVDSLVSQLDRAGREITQRFQSRLDEDAPAFEGDSHELSEPVEELIADAIDAVDSLDESVAPTANDEEALEDLAGQVDELVEDAQRTAAPTNAHEAPAPVETDADTAVDEETTLDADAVADEPIADDADVHPVLPDATTEQTQAQAEQPSPAQAGTIDQKSADEAPKAAEASPGESSDDEVVVIETFDEASDAADERSAPIPPADQGDSMESLDAAIEAEADALDVEIDDLEGGFETIGDVESALASDVEPETPTLDQAVDSPFAQDATAPSTASETDSTSADPAAAPALIGLRPRLRRLTAIAHNVVTFARGRESLALSVLTPMAKPLTMLDPKLRDTVGWVALNTVFIAVCLWLFLLLL